MSGQIAEVVAVWKKSLGDDAVCTDPDAIGRAIENTSSFRAREVIAILRPHSVDHVQRLVRVAAEYAVPLYPFSTGRNWGLGSKLPPRDGCALVDLGELNSIREVNERYHYAVIEPGVTQEQLSNHLRKQGFRLQLNVTGSTPASSIVGNLSERGTGFRKHRTEDLRGVEVVLGTGDLVRTGFWSNDKKLREVHHYRYGVGPYLDGLFTQSGLGVITAAVVDLIPVQEEMRMLMFSFAEQEISTMIDRTAAMYRDGSLRSIMHIFNDKRLLTITSEEFVPTWTGIAAVDGSRAYIEFITGEIRSALEACGAKVSFVTQEEVSVSGADPMVRGMYQLHAGEPNTVFMEGLYKTLGGKSDVADLNELDHSRYGMLVCLPIIPMEGKHVSEALDILGLICARYGVVAAVTLNPVDAHALEAVINVYFDRRDAAATVNAQKSIRDLHGELYGAGFRFYRLDIENMAQIAELDPDLWRAADRLKEAFDPANVLAPGRYSRR